MLYELRKRNHILINAGCYCTLWNIKEDKQEYLMASYIYTCTQIFILLLQKH